VIAASLLALALLAPAPAGAGAGRPSVSLAASPSRVTLGAGSSGRIELTNAGRVAVTVGAATDGLALDLRGRPQLRRASAARWLTPSPRALVLAPGATAVVTVRSAVPRRAEPGDHHAVVLFTTRPLDRQGVSVRMQVGVRVVVRVPGAVVRRLSIGRLRLRGRRVLDVVVANRGNVTEELPRGRLRVELRRGARVLATLHAPRRELLPGASGVVSFSLPGRLRGAVTARAWIRGGSARTLRVRLR
jgi:hypothetical protein